MRGAELRFERLIAAVEAQERPTALVWAWPTERAGAIGEHWGVTFLGGSERERERLLAELRGDPEFQQAPVAGALPRSRDHVVVMPYVPRPLQRALHLDAHRWQVIVKHRRFGGSLYGMAELVRCACEHVGSGKYAFIAPYRHQVKDVAWEPLKALCAGIPGATVNESELRVDLPGGRRLQLYGADNADAIRGTGLDGVVLDEYAYADPEVFGRVIRPALADREGWAIFLGTPHGRNHFAELYDRAVGDREWHAVLYKASDSGVLSAEELAAAQAVMSPDEYAQEFEGVFEGSVRGSYYGALIDEARQAGRIGAVSWQPQIRVSTYWDLGISDATAIIFAQHVGTELHVIDYLEGTGESLAFWAREVQRKPYVYSAHWMPPDARGRELGVGKSMEDLAKELGLRPVRIVPGADVETGIEQARLVLPRCWFDAERCARLIDCLAAYKKSWDAKRQVYQKHPLHDWSSHGADAFRYLAVAQERQARLEAGPARPVYTARGATSNWAQSPWQPLRRWGR